MKKIKIFTNHYYPENFKLNELSKEFSKFYNVEVVSQTPNYPKGDFIKGYSWFEKQEESIGQIRIKRLPVIPRKSNNLMLGLNYLSYIISSNFYSAFTKDKADHVFVYITSPIFISWAGLRFAKRNKIQSTMYLLDLWPGSIISMLNLKSPKITRFLEKMCIKIYQSFDNIIVSSYGFVEVLTDYGVDPTKIHYIPQHAEEGSIIDQEISSNEKILKIVFTGNIGQAQGLDVLVETAEILKENQFKGVHFTIVGDGRYRSILSELIADKKVSEYFTFTGFLHPSKISSILEEHHFGFVSLQDEDIFNRTLPAKVQSYMADGMPILASANGEVPRLIKEASCGYSVQAGDSQALAKLIMALENMDKSTLEKMSENSYTYCIANFNKENITEQFIKIMEKGNLNV